MKNEKQFKKRLFAGLLALCLIGAAFSVYAEKAPDAPGLEMARQAQQGMAANWTTADHSTFQPLKKKFATGEEITEACISCHSEADEQVHKTLHWTWLDPASNPEYPKGKAGYSVNNFCISANAMKDKKCSTCHVGWNGKEEKVNCLTCHGQEKFNFTEAFADLKYFAESGDEDAEMIMSDIQEGIAGAAQKVGLPTRDNCGACHFYGGGGDGVKHGDLDSSLSSPDKALDVHMGVDGQNFQCTRCHTTRNHQIAGRVYGTPAATDRKSLIEDDLMGKIMCESCHTAQPHKADEKLNDHTDKVACQSCHIPAFARKLPTKMWWDWSKAGKLKDGKPYTVEGPLGKEEYMSIKGEMKWAKDVVPEYLWYNGSLKTVTAAEKIDPKKPVRVAWPVGSADDPDARIYPFKIHKGKQPYDPENRALLAPLLSGPYGYWTTFDWQSAFVLGAEALELPYSGKYDFVRSDYVFPTTHMVAPREEALSCEACHAREGRLAQLSGFYMPGRDRFQLLDIAGWLLIFGTLGGVTLHALGRYVFRKNGKKK